MLLCEVYNQRSGEAQNQFSVCRRCNKFPDGAVCHRLLVASVSIKLVHNARQSRVNSDLFGERCDDLR